MNTAFMFESLPTVNELFPAALHPAHGPIFFRKLEVIEIDTKYIQLVGLGITGFQISTLELFHSGINVGIEGQVEKLS